MRVWKRATGVLKDKNSIWAAKLSIRKSGWRNPDLETVVIKATSHDEERIDGKNVQRVFRWLRTSPTLYLKPLVWVLSMRMQKTRSWVVALKGLMLIHGILVCIHDLPLPVMGRLPFDLSNFADAHLNPAKASAFNLFVRSYFAYLDQRSTLYNMSSGSDDEEVKLRVQKKKKIIKGNKEEVIEGSSSTLMEELEKLQTLQAMIDMLLQIKPRSTSTIINMNNNANAGGGLILEAMDCVIVEVFDVYSKFCNKIAGVLLRIYDVCGKMEASIGLKVLQKASVQGDELSLYFEFCRDIGVLNASQCPKIQRISKEDIEDLERIISSGGASSAGKKGLEDKAINVVVRDNYSAATATINLQQHKETENGLITVITHQWEVFDDADMMVGVNGNSTTVFNGETTYTIDTTINNPFQESYTLVPYLPLQNQVLPDLISL